jgi:hypothetical protein
MRLVLASSARTKTVRSRVALALTIVIGLAATLAPAMAAHKRGHRPPHPSILQPAPPPIFDPTGGNAAAGGNNANSMSGSNSAGENANGRSSGGGFGGM